MAGSKTGPIWRGRSGGRDVQSTGDQIQLAENIAWVDRPALISIRTSPRDFGIGVPYTRLPMLPSRSGVVIGTTLGFFGMTDASGHRPTHDHRVNALLFKTCSVSHVLPSAEMAV
jgi:hypothetical protein